MVDVLIDTQITYFFHFFPLFQFISSYSCFAGLHLLPYLPCLNLFCWDRTNGVQVGKCVTSAHFFAAQITVMKWNSDRPFWVWFVCVRSSSGLFIAKHRGLGRCKIPLESSFPSTCWEQFACLASKSLPSYSLAYSSMTYSLYSSHLLWQRWVRTYNLHIRYHSRFFVQKVFRYWLYRAP